MRFTHSSTVSATLASLIDAAHVPGRDEERDLIMSAKNGCKRSRERLILVNLRHALKAAQKYLNPRFPLEDALSASVIGIQKAIDRFSLERQTSFLTYASDWIKFELQKAYKSSSFACQVPDWVFKADARARRRTSDRLSDRDIAEVAAELGMHEETTRIAINTVRGSDCSIEEEISEGLFLKDTIEDPDIEHPTECISSIGENDSLTEKINELLTERQRKILYMIHGINSEPLSFIEIGKRFGISYNAVNLQKNRAVEMLTGSRIAIQVGLPRLFINGKAVLSSTQDLRDEILRSDVLGFRESGRFLIVTLDKGREIRFDPRDEPTLAQKVLGNELAA